MTSSRSEQDGQSAGTPERPVSPQPPALLVTRFFRPEFRIAAAPKGIRVEVTARESSRPRS